MGTFATTTALQTLMPGISFDTATTSLASICITWSEGYIRTKLARRYNVSASPFNTSTSIPTQITSITEKMAMGYLYKQMSRGSKDSLTRGDELLSEAKSDLACVVAGECDLLDNSFAVIADRSTRIEVRASTSAYHTTFDEGDPLNWTIDPDKVSDIDSEKD